MERKLLLQYRINQSIDLGDAIREFENLIGATACLEDSEGRDLGLFSVYEEKLSDGSEAYAIVMSQATSAQLCRVKQPYEVIEARNQKAQKRGR